MTKVYIRSASMIARLMPPDRQLDVGAPRVWQASFDVLRQARSAGFDLVFRHAIRPLAAPVCAPALGGCGHLGLTAESDLVPPWGLRRFAVPP
jgi:hypothetical protein